MDKRPPPCQAVVLALAATALCWSGGATRGNGEAAEIRSGFVLPSGARTIDPRGEEARAPTFAELAQISKGVEVLKDALTRTGGRPEVRERLLAAVRSKYSVARQLATTEIQRVEAEVAGRTAALRRSQTAQYASQTYPSMAHAAVTDEHMAAFQRYGSISNNRGHSSLILSAADALEQRASAMQASLPAQAENDQLRDLLRHDLGMWRRIARHLRQIAARLPALEAAEVRAIMHLHS
jgi:hypothetical protein